MTASRWLTDRARRSRRTTTRFHQRGYRAAGTPAPAGCDRRRRRVLRGSWRSRLRAIRRAADRCPGRPWRPAHSRPAGQRRGCFGLWRVTSAWPPRWTSLYNSTRCLEAAVCRRWAGMTLIPATSSRRRLRIGRALLDHASRKQGNGDGKIRTSRASHFGGTPAR
jgi:hypothetical protein